MRKPIENFLKLRYTVPALIVVMLSLVVLSELSYQRTLKTLKYGIALTEVRIGSAKVLQLLTDAETAQRGYLLTGESAYLKPMENAHAAFDADHASIFKFLEGIGSSGQADAVKIKQDVQAKFAELERTVELHRAGQPAEALAIVKTGRGKQAMEALRIAFDAKLKEATLLQQNAREILYSALWLNRTLVAVLSLLVAAGLYLHLQRSQALDAERSRREKLLESTVADRTRDLRTLAGYLQTAREDEKAYLARELHDELGGLLTAAKLTLARMRDKLSGDAEMLERIALINQHLSQGIALKRRIVEDLRPSSLTSLGLHTALTILCSDASKQLGVPVKTDIADIALSDEGDLAVFRMVQEALTNVGKYAAATQVSVRLETVGDELCLEVADDGAGFDVSQLDIGRHGLAGMRFRMESLHGSMEVASKAGHGTRVRARLPLLTVTQPASLMAA